MVNLKKIGAVATGALFVGATIGMASAVTIPDTFEKSLLASSGVAKAQLVVGKDAPGKTADTASAEIIQSAVADELGVSGTGGQVEIKYGKDDLDDNSANGDDWYQVDADDLNVTTGNNESNKLKLSTAESANSPSYIPIAGAGLKFDSNGDGDLKDSGDYVFYDGVYIIDGSDGTIRMGYNISAHYVDGYYSSDDGPVAGEIVELKGSKYAITDVSNFDSGEMEMGPALVKKISDTGDLDPDRAVTIAENYKIFYDQNSSGNNQYKVHFYEGNSLLDTYTFSSQISASTKLNTEVELGSFEDKYNIYLVTQNTTEEKISMSFVDKDQLIELADEEEGIMGYDVIWINTPGKWEDGIVLLSPVIQLVRDDTVDLEGTYYQLKWTQEKELDIKRKDTKTQSSGAKWKSTKYKDFLQGSSGTDIWISATGGQIEIKYGKDDLDDDSSNGDDWYQVVSDDNETVSLGGNASNKLKLSDAESLNSPSYVPIAGAGLKFDANGDGDLKDSGDYIFYDGVYIIDGSDGTIRMGYNISAHYAPSYYNSADGPVAGEVVKIKGSKYAITDVSDFDSGDMEIGPALVKKISDTGDLDPDRAVTIAENYKIFYDQNETTSPYCPCKIHFYEGNSLLDTYSYSTPISASTPLNTAVELGSFEDKYNIYLVTQDVNAASVSMSFVDKDQLTDLTDEEEGVMGYDVIWINTPGKWEDGIVLLSPVIQLVRDDTVDLEGTYFQLKWTQEKELDIKRKDTKTQSSGAKWKSTKYKDFLQGSSGTDIWISVTGGDTVAPDVEIVDDADADTDDNNVFLIGGPVANTLTAELVTQEKSQVDWEASEGDIEVIADAFTTGKSAVIVAGKDRTKTEAAAQALADAL